MQSTICEQLSAPVEGLEGGGVVDGAGGGVGVAAGGSVIAAGVAVGVAAPGAAAQKFGAPLTPAWHTCPVGQAGLQSAGLAISGSSPPQAIVSAVSAVRAKSLSSRFMIILQK